MRNKTLALVVACLAISASTMSQTAHFECLVDGKAFNGTGNNAFCNIALRSADDMVNFVLVPMSPTSGIPAQINFFVKPTGTTTIKENGGKYSVIYSSGGMDHDYQTNGVTVTIRHRLPRG